MNGGTREHPPAIDLLVAGGNNPFIQDLVLTRSYISIIVETWR